MADDKAKEEAAPEAPAGPKMIMGMTIPVLAIVLVNVLVMLGGTGYITFVNLVYKPKPILEEQAVKEITSKAEKKAAGATETASGVFIEEFGEMTVNLKGGTGGKSHYATIEPAMECSNAACIELVKEYKAKIEDLIQTKFSAKSFTELNALETRFRIRHEILQQINTFINNGAVTNLYFNSFVVQ